MAFILVKPRKRIFPSCINVFSLPITLLILISITSVLSDDSFHLLPDTKTFESLVNETAASVNMNVEKLPLDFSSKEIKQVTENISILMDADLKISVSNSKENQHDYILSKSGYVKYYPGNGLNIILSAPHGGLLEPIDLPDRDAGCVVEEQCQWLNDCGNKNSTKCPANTIHDYCTQDLTEELYESICKRFKSCPAAIINLLHRKKFDANRDLEEATFNVPEVVEVFKEYHEFIEHAKRSIKWKGLFLDIHGHSHKKVRVELGYLLNTDQLNDLSYSLNLVQSSIKHLAQTSKYTFEELIRGPKSFGSLLEKYKPPADFLSQTSHSFKLIPSSSFQLNQNATETFNETRKNRSEANATNTYPFKNIDLPFFQAVPSQNDPAPKIGELYFRGGYNSLTHGSRDGGLIDSIQIETPKIYRLMPMRILYVEALTETLEKFMKEHY